MSIRKKKEQPIAPVVPDYPMYYKTGETYTAVLSKSNFIQVKVLKTQTSIVNGNNVHIVSEAARPEQLIEREKFINVFKQAMQRVQSM